MDLQRYHRQILLPEIGIGGQRRLSNARVLVVGAGGLGCPVLIYLASCGVGHITILDPELIEQSNLHRQILFRDMDVGRSKAIVASTRLREINPDIRIEGYQESLSTENAIALVSQHDLIVDGTDNFPSRYLVNDACVISEKPFVAASIFKFEGQLSVYNMPRVDGSFGPTYRCLYPTPPAPGTVPSCAEIGVLGVLPGIMGTFQAMEAIKVIVGLGEILDGRLLVFNTLSGVTKSVAFNRCAETDSIKTLLADYSFFCEGGSTLSNNVNNIQVKEITVLDLKERLDNGDKISLIDVREPFERELCEIGGTLIPLKQIEERLADIPKEGPVVVYCRSGGRSSNAVQLLSSRYGYSNLINLKGGILAWADQIDPSIQKY